MNVAADLTVLAGIADQLLVAIGEDPTRPGLVGTPARWARWWQEFVDHDPGTLETAFEETTADNLVLVRGMRLWSLCEHHLLPFSARVDCAYIPAGGRVLGLSKFARVAHLVAHRLQVQERLTAQIADEMTRLTGSGDVAVKVTGEHLCMAMRGVRTPAEMVTSALRGGFCRPEVRAEFLALAGGVR